MSFLLIAFASQAFSQTPKLPKLNDPALRLEALAAAPDIEAPTTVCSAPDGSFYVGCDPRDTRLNTDRPECYIVRYSSMGADKKRTVFVDKIYSPAGSQWLDGWLYVTHDPFLSRFKDTDGDGVAEVREDLVTNLGHVPYGGLNDHCVSGFTLGMDGYFYISVGDRGVYQAKGKDGSTLTMQGGGIIRCRPDGTKLNIFSSGTRNHLAVLLDAEDNAFTRDNTDDGNGWWTRLTHHIEGGYYGYPYDYQHAPNYGVTQPSPQTLDAMKRNGHDALIQPGVAPTNFLPAMADFGGGSPTGGVCYLSDGLPEQYRGKLLFSEWGKAALFVTEVARDGATFKLVKDTPLIESAKGADFRPMQVSVAPDGSVLIADWGWGGWKAPKQEGAVWRLSWPEAKPAPRLRDENKASVDELLAALGHPDRDQRLRAQSPLVRAIVRLDSESQASMSPAYKKKLDALIVQIREAAEKGFRPGEEERLQNLVSAAIGSGRWTDEATEYFGKDLLKDDAKVRDGLRSNYASAIGKLTQSAQERGKETVGRIHAIWVLSELASTKGMDVDVSIYKWRFNVVDRLLEISRSESGTSQIMRALRAVLQEKQAWADLSGNASFLKGLEATILDTAMSDNSFVKADGARLASELPDTVNYSRERLVRAIVPLLAEPEPVVRSCAQVAMRRLARQQPDTTFKVFSELKDGVLRKAFCAAFPSDRIEFVEFAASELPHSAQSDKVNELQYLSTAAFRVKPWDGHWWGTQPVKSSKPRNSVPWEGTGKAMEALTNALADVDEAVRLEAARAFSEFLLNESAKAEKSQGASALAALRQRLKAETSPAVSKQLIQSLGVQRDPEALASFAATALDSNADSEIRDAAIGAVVSIGGDAAKKTIIDLAGADLSPTALRKVIEAIGSMKVGAATPQLVAHLNDADPMVRLASIKAMNSIGVRNWSSEGTHALLTALDDKDGKVAVAAIEALGNARVAEALPRFITLAEKNKYRRETVTAIAAMGNESTVPLLVTMLGDGNPSIRRDAAKALKRFRATALPLIEQKLASGEIRAEFGPEIRSYFESGVIEKWKMIGPFENVWDAVHPPEKDALAAAGKPDVARKYSDAEGKEASWRDINANGEEGRVDIGKVFKTNAMVCAYAWTEIDAPEAGDARILCGSDDQIAIWLNGQRVHNASASREFQPDKDEVPIQFAAGKNQLLVKIGNIGGSWEFAVRIPGVSDGKFIKSKELTPEEKQRAFVLATKPDGSWLHPGDAKHGEKLFFDPAAGVGAICATCHAIKGKGGQIGPDLTTIAVNYKRPDLLVSLLEPSKTIALGFEQAIVETTGGETFVGAQRQETNETLTLVGADGQPHVVKKSEIKSRKAIEQSLMPPGLTLALKPQDVADLIAYLEQQRGQ